MKSRVYGCITEMADRIAEQKDYLTELDRAIGDADHGINMARGFEALREKLDPEEQDIGAALGQAAMCLISNVGGASGPLYGTAFMRAAAPAKGKQKLTPAELLELLDAGIAGIKMRGKSETGEKTMLDALVPAREALAEAVAAGAEPAEALKKMCTAAQNGAEQTKEIRATKGRASYLGERSIGHVDPGAASSAILLGAVRTAMLQE